MTYVLRLTEKQMTQLEALVDLALRTNGISYLPLAVEMVNTLKNAQKEEPAPETE